jgi:hypothetical protein
MATLQAPHSKFPIWAVKITMPLPFFRALSKLSKPTISTLSLSFSLEIIGSFIKSAIFFSQLK